MTEAETTALLPAGLRDILPPDAAFAADLVQRLRTGQPLAKFDRRTLYTPGAAGYNDYPAIAAETTTTTA